MSKILVLLVGPNGAGKNTICKRIVPLIKNKSWSVESIESGEICRNPESYLVPTHIADKLNEAQRDGVIAPCDIAFEAVSSVLDKSSGNDVLILDGFPRTRKQLDLTTKWSAISSRRIVTVFVHTPLDVCIERMSANKRGRSDDADQKIRLRRISNFLELTCPMISVMRSGYRGRFVQIDGTDAREVNISPIMVALGLHPKIEDTPVAPIQPIQLPVPA